MPLSVPPHKLETDWAASCAEVILRRCPACEIDSIIGHGRRRKQARDEHHDWIGIRRGRCPGCGRTFTFLPCFSLPYTVDDPASLDRALSGAVAVINCAGPFIDTAGPVVDGRYGTKGGGGR